MGLGTLYIAVPVSLLLSLYIHTESVVIIPTPTEPNNVMYLNTIRKTNNKKERSGVLGRYEVRGGVGNTLSHSLLITRCCLLLPLTPWQFAQNSTRYSQPMTMIGLAGLM